MRKPDPIIILTIFSAIVQSINAFMGNDVQLWIATIIIWCLSANVVFGRIEINNLREWIDAKA